jgi:hypothetical protein
VREIVILSTGSQEMDVLATLLRELFPECRTTVLSQRDDPSLPHTKGEKDAECSAGRKGSIKGPDYEPGR